MRRSSIVALPDLVPPWYRANRRDLPWRRPGTTPWGVLVSEIMLQQTPVARVEPVWLSWMDAWPRPSALAAAARADRSSWSPARGDAPSRRSGLRREASTSRTT